MRVCCQYLCLQQVSLLHSPSTPLSPSSCCFFCELRLSNAAPATWTAFCCLRPCCLPACLPAALVSSFALREALVKSTRNNWQLWLPFLLTYAALLLPLLLLPHLLLYPLPFLLTFNCSFLQLPVAWAPTSAQLLPAHIVVSPAAAAAVVAFSHASFIRSWSWSRSQSLSQHAQALSLSHPVALWDYPQVPVAVEVVPVAVCLLPLLIVT